MSLKRSASNSQTYQDQDIDFINYQTYKNGLPPVDHHIRLRTGIYNEFYSIYFFI